MFLTGEELPHYLGQFDDDALYRRIRSLPVGAAPTLDPELHYDRRNYDRVTAQQIEQECDCPAHGVERWAELPPLEYILVIPVVWGAARFAGSFLDELGRAAGQALVAKIRSGASKSKRPDRSLVFVIEFKLNERARMCGFVIVGPSDPDNVLELAWDNIEPLATLAGLQAEQEFLPGLIDSAFFLDGDRWQLGWWTDGERVMESTWFQQNPPDSAGVLGHPPLHKPDRGTTTDT